MFVKNNAYYDVVAIVARKTSNLAYLQYIVIVFREKTKKHAMLNDLGLKFELLYLTTFF